MKNWPVPAVFLKEKDGRSRRGVWQACAGTAADSSAATDGRRTAKDTVKVINISFNLVTRLQVSMVGNFSVECKTWKLWEDIPSVKSHSFCGLVLSNHTEVRGEVLALVSRRVWFGEWIWPQLFPSVIYLCCWMFYQLSVTWDANTESASAPTNASASPDTLERRAVKVCSETHSLQNSKRFCMKRTVLNDCIILSCFTRYFIFF